MKKFAIPILNGPVRHNESFKNEDIPVGANVDVGETESEKINIPLKNIKIRKKKEGGKKALRDHDYSFSEKL